MGDEKTNEGNPEQEGVGIDLEKASREELAELVSALKEKSDKDEARIVELEGDVEGLSSQCTDLAGANDELAKRLTERPVEAFRGRADRAPRYVPPRKLQGAELEAAKRRVMKQYGGEVVVNVGATFITKKDEKGKTVRVRDKTKATHVPLKKDHIIGINEGKETLTAILADTQKLRITKPKK